MVSPAAAEVAGSVDDRRCRETASGHAGRSRDDDHNRTAYIRYEAGYELLHVAGKGAKPADIPLPIPVLRAVHEAIGGRTSGPILRTRTGRRMDRSRDLMAALREDVIDGLSSGEVA